MAEVRDDSATVQEFLANAGLIGEGDVIALVPLTGGVSCDVWRVDVADAPVCVVKRALPQLKVEADWFAPVERTEIEVLWLKRAHAIVPHLTPAILADDDAQHMFAMAFLPPENHPVWKAELFNGHVDVAFAGAMGRDLVKVHAATANNPDIAAQFDTMDLFVSLRVEPFFRYVANARDDVVAARLNMLADALEKNGTVLVHGDVSPKNILMGPNGPVLLDAECAVYGDPAFDVAFCITHLLLKSVVIDGQADALRASALAMAQEYLAGVTWEDRDTLSHRAANLTAALILARVDGKSPAPYMKDHAARDAVRNAAVALLSNTPPTLENLITHWHTA